MKQLAYTTTFLSSVGLFAFGAVTASTLVHVGMIGFMLTLAVAIVKGDF